MEKKLLTIYKEFTFDSAHCLPCVPDGHPCGGLHGHTWKLSVGITGEIDEERGWIFDFGDIKRVVKEHVIDILDHAYLNKFVTNPTSENLVHWVWEQLAARIIDATDKKAQLYEIIIYETPTSYASLRSQ